MRNFKEPHYTSDGCVCCKVTSEDVLDYRERLLEALKAEQVRSRLGFIQYKELERIINGIN
jgi:G3E family GTPase